jgi:hypothetical protein
LLCHGAYVSAKFAGGLISIFRRIY